MSETSPSADKAPRPPMSRGLRWGIWGGIGLLVVAGGFGFYHEFPALSTTQTADTIDVGCPAGAKGVEAQAQHIDTASWSSRVILHCLQKGGALVAPISIAVPTENRTPLRAESPAGKTTRNELYGSTYKVGVPVEWNLNLPERITPNQPSDPMIQRNAGSVVIGGITHIGKPYQMANG